MANPDFGCGRAECHASTSIAEPATYGTGRLDANGFWEFPCAACELANHSRVNAQRSFVTRVYCATLDGALRECLFCGRVLRSGQEVVDMNGPAIGKVAHAACEADAAASGVYV